MPSSRAKLPSWCAVTAASILVLVAGAAPAAALPAATSVVTPDSPAAASPAAATTAAATTARAPRPTGRIAQEWAPLHMSDQVSYTEAEAVALARRFDVLSAIPLSLQAYVPAMKQVNPGLTILSYANADFSYRADGSLPSEWYARDTAGRRITSSAYGNYLMDPTQLGWRNHAVSACVQGVAASGYDGCLVDMLTMGVFSKNYVSSLPVDPSTGQEYAQAAWRDQQSRMAALYTSDAVGLAIAGNCVTNEWRYWHHDVSSHPIAYALPAAQQEDFLRGAADPVDQFLAEDRWVDNVNIVRDLEAHGVGGLITTKVWSGGTAEQLRGWHRYAMATFLMGAGGRSFFAFTDNRSKAGASGTDQRYRMPRSLGAALGAMAKTGGVYQRAFAGGLAVVNPTPSPVTVSLPGTYTSLDGVTTNRLTLAANSGDVLVQGGIDTAPTGAISRPAALASVGSGMVLFDGSAADDAAVRSVSLAVRDRATGRWLRADGTFGSYLEQSATLAAPGTTSTTWSRTLTLPPGSYGVQLLVRDSMGTPSKADWTTFTVSP